MIMNKLIAAGLAGTILALSAAPASASFGLFCQGEGIDIEVPMGGAVGLNPLAATIKAGDKVWTTEQSSAATIQIVPVQSAATDNRIYLDFSDPELSAILVQIRLFWAEEETDPVYGGVIRIADYGVKAISCGMG
jgi:hypothetical protein